MEQAMRKIERTRAQRMDALRKIELIKPTRSLSAYFAVRPSKVKIARRHIKAHD